MKEVVSILLHWKNINDAGDSYFFPVPSSDNLSFAQKVPLLHSQCLKFGWIDSMSGLSM